MNRALGGGERQWWVQSLRAACNIGLAACIDAPVDRGRFEQAMHWLQRRYPLLAVSLEVSEDGEPRFVSGRAPGITLVWRERTGIDDWRAVGAEETTRGFPSEGPFIRFSVVAGPDATDVILCISHMIGDGLSMAQIMNDVILFLQDPTRPAVPVVDKGQLDERAPSSYRRRWLPFAQHLAEQILGAPHDPGRNARLRASYRGKERNDWITIALAPDETERLRVASRAQRTTVQGALTAAVTLAIGEHEARYGRKKIAVHSPINLRAILDPPVVDEIGNYASGTTLWIRTDAELWDIARAVKADIEQAIARGTPFANERLGRGTKRKTPRTSPRWLALRVWPDLGVTNLGLVRLPDTPIGDRVREMHVLVALPVMQTLVAAVVTVRGRLFCDIIYCPDDISKEDVEPIVASARRKLQSAMGT